MKVLSLDEALAEKAKDISTKSEEVNEVDTKKEIAKDDTNKEAEISANEAKKKSSGSDRLANVWCKTKKKGRKRKADNSKSEPAEEAIANSEELSSELSKDSNVEKPVKAQKNTTETSGNTEEVPNTTDTNAKNEDVPENTPSPRKLTKRDKMRIEAGLEPESKTESLPMKHVPKDRQYSVKVEMENRSVNIPFVKNKTKQGKDTATEDSDKKVSVMKIPVKKIGPGQFQAVDPNSPFASTVIRVKKEDEEAEMNGTASVAAEPAPATTDDPSTSSQSHSIVKARELTRKVGEKASPTKNPTRQSRRLKMAAEKDQPAEELPEDNADQSEVEIFLRELNLRKKSDNPNSSTEEKESASETESPIKHAIVEATDPEAITSGLDQNDIDKNSSVVPEKVPEEPVHENDAAASQEYSEVKEEEVEESTDGQQGFESTVIVLTPSQRAAPAKPKPGQQPWLPCKFCDRQFSRYIYLYKHLRKEHIDMPDQQSYLRYQEVVRDKMKVHCPICKAAVHSILAFKTHMDNYHPSGSIGDSARCVTCAKSFKNQSSLNRHIAKSHKNTDESGMDISTCEQCGAKFPDRKMYRLHAQEVHGVSKVFKCKVCNKGMSTKAALQDHMTTHGAYEFYCAYCNAGAHNQKDMERHKTTSHELIQGRSYSCRHCRTSFTTKKELTSHIHETHFYNPTFDCEVCHMGFWMKRNLTQHRRQNHPEVQAAIDRLNHTKEKLSAQATSRSKKARVQPKIEPTSDHESSDESFYLSDSEMPPQNNDLQGTSDSREIEIQIAIENNPDGTSSATQITGSSSIGSIGDQSRIVLPSIAELTGSIRNSYHANAANQPPNTYVVNAPSTEDVVNISIVNPVSQNQMIVNDQTSIVTDSVHNVVYAHAADSYPNVSDSYPVDNSYTVATTQETHVIYTDASGIPASHTTPSGQQYAYETMETDEGNIIYEAPSTDHVEQPIATQSLSYPVDGQNVIVQTVPDHGNIPSFISREEQT